MTETEPAAAATEAAAPPPPPAEVEEPEESEEVVRHFVMIDPTLKEGAEVSVPGSLTSLTSRLVDSTC
jgi:hypothetical protein